MSIIKGRHSKDGPEKTSPISSCMKSFTILIEGALLRTLSNIVCQRNRHSMRVFTLYRKLTVVVLVETGNEDLRLDSQREKEDGTIRLFTCPFSLFLVAGWHSKNLCFFFGLSSFLQHLVPPPPPGERAAQDHHHHHALHRGGQAGSHGEREEMKSCAHNTRFPKSDFGFYPNI